MAGSSSLENSFPDSLEVIPAEASNSILNVVHSQGSRTAIALSSVPTKFLSTYFIRITDNLPGYCLDTSRILLESAMLLASYPSFEVLNFTSNACHLPAYLAPCVTYSQDYDIISMHLLEVKIFNRGLQALNEGVYSIDLPDSHKIAEIKVEGGSASLEFHSKALELTVVIRYIGQSSKRYQFRLPGLDPMGTLVLKILLANPMGNVGEVLLINSDLDRKDMYGYDFFRKSGKISV
jgi:hypothetical protein